MKVKCINNVDYEKYLTVDKVYDVTPRDGFYSFVGDNGTKDCEAFQWRFETVKEEETKPQNKYNREIRPNVWCDVYDVIRAFSVNDPCLQHAIKKLLAAGERGHKDRLEDLQDIVDSVQRAIEMHKEWSEQ
jgi:trehalose-6-phosphatase